MAVNTFVNVNSLSANDKEKLRHVIVDLNDSFIRATAESDYQKETIDTISKNLNLDKKLVRKMARTYYNANYNTEIEEYKTFEEFYTVIFNASPETLIA